MQFTGWMGFASALNKLARPYLTFFITLIYNVALLIALYHGKLEVKEYIMAVGPMNAMIIGFWFGERAAMTRSEKDAPGAA